MVKPWPCATDQESLSHQPVESGSAAGPYISPYFTQKTDAKHVKNIVDHWLTHFLKVILRGRMADSPGFQVDQDLRHCRHLAGGGAEQGLSPYFLEGFTHDYFTLQKPSCTRLEPCEESIRFICFIFFLDLLPWNLAWNSPRFETEIFSGKGPSVAATRSNQRKSSK